MAGYVGRLEAGDVLAAAPFFEGPWHSFSRQIVEPGRTEEFEATRAEYAIFVMSGAGEARVGATTRPITPGSALTVGHRATLTLTAADTALELFVTTLTVP